MINVVEGICYVCTRPYAAPTTDSAIAVIVKHLMTKHHAQVKSDTLETKNKFDTFFHLTTLLVSQKRAISILTTEFSPKTSNSCQESHIAQITRFSMIFGI